MNNSFPEGQNKRKKYMAHILLLAVCLLITLLKLRADAGMWTLRTVMSPGMWLSGFFWIGHTYLSILLLLLLALKNRFTAYVIIPAVLFLWLLTLYILFTYGYVGFAEQVVALLCTDWNELSGLVTPTLVSTFLIAGLLLETGMWAFTKYCSVLVRKIRGIYLFSIFAGYVALSTALVQVCSHYCPSCLLPVLFGFEVTSLSEESKKSLTSTIQNDTSPAYIQRCLIPFYRQIYLPYYVIKWYMPQQLKKSEEIPHTLNESMGENLTVVLVIGESYRADHAAWNGYHRMTLPQLSAHRDNITNFPFFASYATSTVASIYGILTDATCVTRDAKHTSFLGILKQHHFGTHLLLSRTTHWEYTPAIYKALDQKLDNVYELEDSEGVAKKVCELAQKPGKKLILIEDGTGHAPYEHEAQFSIFGREIMDKYDNALLQADDLLSRIISGLKEREAVLLYTSDHGQSFGEGGCYMHGGALDRIEQRHVFSFLWTSDTYAEKQKNMLQHIRANSKKHLSHDDVFYSILSLSGIECHTPNAKALNFTKPLIERNEAEEFKLPDEMHPALGK